MYQLVLETLCNLWGVSTSVIGTGSNIALAVELQTHVVMWLFFVLVVALVYGIFKIFANLF